MDDIFQQLDGTTNVLFAEPPMGQSRDLCTSLLLDQHPAPNVLYVTYTRSPAACIDDLGDIDGPDNVGIITVGDGGTVDDDRVVTESVSTASDLTGLGIAISRFLSDWEAPVFICFDSLTSMLQYVDVQTAYEFLHAITGQIHAAGAMSHFHIDPSAHDEKHVAAITSLFDGKVSLDSETVRTRDILEATS